MTMHNAQTIPIHLADPHKGVLPHAYVVLKHSQICACGSIHQWSELYAKTHLKSRLGHGYVTNLRPLHNGPEYNLPIEVIPREAQRLAFCHECASRTLSHLPSPPIEEAQTVVGLGTETGVAGAPTASKAKPKTLDTLLDMLK